MTMTAVCDDRLGPAIPSVEEDTRDVPLHTTLPTWSSIRRPASAQSKDSSSCTIKVCILIYLAIHNLFRQPNFSLFSLSWTL